MQKLTYQAYEKNFSPDKLWAKLKGNLKSLSSGIILKILELYYATQNPAMPLKIKLQIYGVLGYFILPFDFIPDMTVMLGYTDDIAAITYIYTVAQSYIDDIAKAKAAERLHKLMT